uniref:BEACH domain-containing protein n=1 Tax=Eptatretus burgeri TaxID=7764 RepID=A0A8C4N483_EPTBU
MTGAGAVSCGVNTGRQHVLLFPEVCGLVVQLLVTGTTSPDLNVVCKALQALHNIAKSREENVASLNEQVCVSSLVLYRCHLSSLLKLQVVLVDLLVTLAAVQISPEELTLLLKLFTVKSPPTELLLDALLHVVQANMEPVPSQFLTFPLLLIQPSSSMGGAPLPTAWTQKVKGRTASRMLHVFQDISGLHANKKPDQEIAVQGPHSVWSLASLQLSLPASQACWPHHVASQATGFSVALWLRLEPVGEVEGCLEGERVVVIDYPLPVRSGDRLPTNCSVHLISIGSRCLMLQVWAEPAYGLLVFRVVVDPGDGKKADLLAQAESREGVLAPSQWHHMALSYRQRNEGKRNAHGRLAVWIDGRRNSEVALDFATQLSRKAGLPSDKLKTCFVGHSVASQEDVDHFGCSWSLGNLLVFNDAVLDSLSAFHLYSCGPDLRSVLPCKLGVPPPLYTRYADLDILRTGQLQDLLIRGQGLNLSSLRASVCLTYSPGVPATYTIYEYPSPGRGQRRSSSYRQPPIPRDVSLVAGKSVLVSLYPRVHQGLQASLYNVGCIGAFIFLFARVVELCTSEEAQACALQSVLSLAKRHQRRWNELTADRGHAMLFQVLGKPRAFVGFHVLKVLLDAACDCSVLSWNPERSCFELYPETHAVIQDVELLGSMLSAWRVWARAQAGVWETLMAAMEILIRETHPAQMFNVKQLLRARLVEQLLLTCLLLQNEHEDPISLPPAVSRALVRLVEELIGSPPDSELLASVCSFLLAAHSPASTYVCHTSAAFYFSLHTGVCVCVCACVRGWSSWFKSLVFEASGLLVLSTEEVLLPRLGERPCDKGTDGRRGSASCEVDLGVRTGSAGEGSPAAREVGARRDHADGRRRGTQQPQTGKSRLPFFFLCFCVNVCWRRLSQTEDGLLLIFCGLYRLLHTMLLLLPDSMLPAFTDGLLTPEMLIVLCNHPSPDARLSVVKVLDAHFQRATDEQKTAFVRGHGFYLLANQLHQHVASRSLVETFLSLLRGQSLALDGDVKDIPSFQRRWVVPLLALVVPSLHDTLLAHDLLFTLLRLFGACTRLADILLDSGLLSVLCNAATVTLPRSDGGLLLGDIQQFLLAATLHACTSAGSHYFRLLDDLLAMLGHFQTSQHARTQALAAALQFKVLHASINFIHSVVTARGRGITSSFSLPSKPHHALQQKRRSIAGTLPMWDSIIPRQPRQHLPSHASPVTPTSLQLGSSERIPKTWTCHNILPLALHAGGRHLASGQDNVLIAQLRSAASEEFTRLVQRRLSHDGVVCAREAELTQRLQRVSVMAVNRLLFHGTCTRRITQICRETFRVQFARLLLHILSPLRPFSERLLGLSLLLEPSCKEILREVLTTPLQPGPKLAVSAFELLWEKSGQLSRQEHKSVELLLTLLKQAGTKIPGSCPAWPETLETLALFGVFHVDRLLGRIEARGRIISRAAAQVTQRVASRQGLERKRVMEHLREACKADLGTQHSWHALFCQLTHERAVWFDPVACPMSWQLDPTEGPSRERRRLQRCRLHVPNKYLLKDRRQSDDISQPLLSYLFEDKSHFSGASAVKDRATSEPTKFTRHCVSIVPSRETPGELLLGKQLSLWHWLYFGFRLHIKCHLCKGLLRLIVTDTICQLPDPDLNQRYSITYGSDFQQFLYEQYFKLFLVFFFSNSFTVFVVGFDFGIRQNGSPVHHVSLPPWARSDPRLFVLIHRQALESDHMSLTLCHWIDLVFGHKQKGRAAVQAINVFHPATYFGMDVSAVEDPVQQRALETMIRTYGQTPRQLFTVPHPSRCPARSPSEMETTSAMGIFVQFAFRESHEVARDISVPSPLPWIRGLKWGEYVGSPSCPDPVVCFSQAHPGQSFGCLLPLPTRAICGLAQNFCLLMTYSKEQGVRTMHSTDIQWSAILSWGYVDNSLRLKSKQTGPALSVVQCDQVCCCAWTPDSRQLYTGNRAGVLTVYGTHFSSSVPLELELERKVCFYGHKGGIAALHVCKPFSILVSASQDGTCILWDLNRLCYVQSLMDHKSPVNAISVSDTTGDIASACHSVGGGSDLRLWTVNGDLIGHMHSPEAVCSLAFSNQPEGVSVNVIAGGLENGVVRLWSTWDLKAIREIMYPKCSLSITSLTFSVDGLYLFTADEEGKVMSWCRRDHIRNKPPLFYSFLSGFAE